ncbi:7149_t:CDS:2, partial [Dentiscutata heterogama]
MASTSIPIEEYNSEQKDFPLHNREQVTMIVCSPNFKYIATRRFRDKNFEYNHIIKSDKIVGFNTNGTLVIKKLIPDKSDTWISYLREILNDSNSIFMSSDSEKIKNLIRRADDKSKETTDKTVIDKSKKIVGKSTKDIGKSEEKTAEVEKTYSKYFITWTLKYENNKKYIILTAKFKKDNKKDDETKSDSIQIVPELYIKAIMNNKEFINECNCLNN